MLYFDGSKITTGGLADAAAASYWISNTLTSNLSNAQMLGIAASLTRAHG